METEPIRSLSTDNFDSSNNLQTQAQGQYQKIRGVLIFVATGLFLSVLQNLGAFIASLAPVFRSPVWERLTTPGSPAYHPYWKTILIYELVANASFLLVNVVSLILFFQKRRVFPKLIVAVIPTIFLVMLIDHYLAGLIPFVAESSTHAKQVHVLIIKFLALHIWIPYFLVSKRVRETFVR